MLVEKKQFLFVKLIIVEIMQKNEDVPLTMTLWTRVGFMVLDDHDHGHIDISTGHAGTRGT